MSDNVEQPGFPAGRSPAVWVRGGAANVRVVNTQAGYAGVTTKGAGAGVLVQGTL